MTIVRYKILLIALLFIGACTSAPQQKTNAKKSKTKVVAPTFNVDSAYSFIEQQVGFGPRALSSKGWKDCGLWLENKLKTYTSNVILQEAPVTTYDGKNHTLKNIIASFSPDKNNRIALFAHWDTRPIADHDTKNQDSPILGANDGGSGVGVLIELARQFRLKPPKIGVDIILFDAEDYGQPENSNYPVMQDSWCLGSQYWSKNPHKANYYARFGILLDMVGGKNATFYLEANSTFYANSTLQKVWKKAHKLGFTKHFIYQKSPQILDDHYYVNTLAAIPTIDIIEYSPLTKNNFNKHWHTHGDDMNNINRNTLKAVGQTVIEVIYNE